MKVVLRTRINGRIADPQEKYRDEITQEGTIEIDLNETDLGDLGALVEMAEAQMVEMKAKFYAELARLGGRSYG
jgi:hypothetical protein